MNTISDELRARFDRDELSTSERRKFLEAEARMGYVPTAEDLRIRAVHRERRQARRKAMEAEYRAARSVSGS